MHAARPQSLTALLLFKFSNLLFNEGRLLCEILSHLRFTSPLVKQFAHTRALPNFHRSFIFSANDVSKKTCFLYTAQRNAYIPLQSALVSCSTTPVLLATVFRAQFAQHSAQRDAFAQTRRISGGTP
jgi:hypothetical protein